MQGIYALYWWDQDLIYVGMTQNLNKRKREHSNAMHKNVHHNYQVQNAYHLYGTPEFIVLEYVDTLEQLADKEIAWCYELDALNTEHGLCIIEPGISAYGTQARNSKYTKIDILRVFVLLYKTSLSYQEISDLTKVSAGNIKSIKLGKCHLWLKEKYPDKYGLMQKRRFKGTSNVNKKYGLLQKNGTVYHIINIAQFCREIFGTEVTHQSAISAVLRGRKKSHKGFTLV